MLGSIKVPAPVHRFAVTTAFKVKRHMPEILFGVGAIGFVATVVTASRATLRADVEVKKYKEKKERISEARKEATEHPDVLTYTEKDEKRDLLTAKVQLGVSIAKLYLVPVGLGLLSLTAFGKAQATVKAESVKALAAFKAAEEQIKKIRKRVTDKYGEEEAEEIMTGIRKRTGVVTEVDEETGEVKEVEKEVRAVQAMKEEAMMDDYSDYGVFFNEFTSSQYIKGDDQANEMTIRRALDFYNNKLDADGFVMLCDILQTLGIDRTKMPKSFLVGWLKDNPVGDQFISFGSLVPCYREGGERVLPTGRIVKYMGGKEWFLDFNFDGVIVDQIGKISRAA